MSPKLWKVGDKVRTPTGMTGTVVAVGNRVVVRYDKFPPWQPPDVKGSRGGAAALEVALLPGLLASL